METILEVAKFAPTAMNYQPHKVYVEEMVIRL